MKILFLCVANSARSQLAEGLAKSVLGPDFEIQSAGSAPSGQVQPYAVEVLKEIGIDISQHYSKSIPELPPKFLAEIDYVVTLCAEEVCPVLPSTRAKKLHWPVSDPAAAVENEKRSAFRTARDTIRKKIEGFAKDILEN